MLSTRPRRMHGMHGHHAREGQKMKKNVKTECQNFSMKKQRSVKKTEKHHLGATYGIEQANRKSMAHTLCPLRLTRIMILWSGLKYGRELCSLICPLWFPMALRLTPNDSSVCTGLPALSR